MRETIVDRAYAKTLLPPRKEDGHKGDFGKLLVLGGSVGYTGAPYLAASAAVHSGCGLVYLGVPESIWAVEAQKCVSAMPFPLPETDGRLCLAALDKMQDKLKGCDVLALGPGLGRGAHRHHGAAVLEHGHRVGGGDAFIIQKHVDLTGGSAELLERRGTLFGLSLGKLGFQCSPVEVIFFRCVRGVGGNSEGECQR